MKLRIILACCILLTSLSVLASHVVITQKVEVEPSVSGSITSLYVQTNTVDIEAGGCGWLFYSPQLPDHCHITYELLPDDKHTQGDGGHNHPSTDRPLGSIAINGVETDEYEYFDYGNAGHKLTYTAPPFSGDIILRSTHCTNAGGGHPCFQEDRLIHVKYPGLAKLPVSLDYELNGSTGSHPDNHYGNSAMIGLIKAISKEWVETFPDQPVLKINDISLQYGGHFDIYQNWAGPHKQHIFGNDVDIHYVGDSYRLEFAEMIEAEGNVRYQVVHSNHHHVSLHR